MVGQQECVCQHIQFIKKTKKLHSKLNQINLVITAKNKCTARKENQQQENS
jgi:hypothetical protein